MSIESSSTTQPVQRGYPRRTLAQKAAMAFVSVLVSSTLLGGVLGLFESRSQEAAMARAAVETAPSIDGLAVRTVASQPRG